MLKGTYHKTEDLPGREMYTPKDFSHLSLCLNFTAKRTQGVKGPSNFISSVPVSKPRGRKEAVREGWLIYIQPVAGLKV